MPPTLTFDLTFLINSKDKTFHYEAKLPTTLAERQELRRLKNFLELADYVEVNG